MRESDPGFEFAEGDRAGGLRRTIPLRLNNDKHHRPEFTHRLPRIRKQESTCPKCWPFWGRVSSQRAMNNL